VRYPDAVLHEDEEVLVHCHPHWSTVFWPVTGVLTVVGTASFATAAVPPGAAQGDVRLGVLGVGAVLVLLLARPLLRWAATHVVLTDRRVLQRRGLLGRRGRDLTLGRVTGVSFAQKPVERVLGAGTLVLEVAGAPRPAVLRHVPRVEVVHGLVEALRGDPVPEEPAWHGDPVVGPA
jgi:uncharacterized membrane protein YdbT with pleckstrin-like domain